MRSSPETTLDARTPGVIARWALPLAAALAFSALVVAFGTRNTVAATSGVSGFAAQVDLRPLGAVAVHHEGRLKSFDSYANGMMNFVSGSRKIAGQTPGFTYLDMLFRPRAYDDADVIYIKNKPVREQMSEVLLSARPDLADRMAVFMQTGLISEKLVLDPSMRPLIDTLQADLVRTERVVRELNSALAVKQPEVLLQNLRIIPPPDGDLDRRWHGINEIMSQPAADASAITGHPPVHGAGSAAARDPDVPRIVGLDRDLERAIAGHWRSLINGWSRQDAAVVNAAVVDLAAALHSVNPEIYPSQGRLGMEAWYFAAGNMSWIWVIYLIGTMPLLMWAVYRWPGALRLGLSLFACAFILQTAAVGVRWYVAARWPNSNMFEAVTTAAWMGGVAAVFLEILLRRTGFRGLFALGSAVASMVALMAAHFLPAYLNPNISNMMPVLHDIWLYIHVNVIIFSYCLIFMAAVSAVLYLVWRLFGGGPAYAKAGGAGGLIVPSARSGLVGGADGGAWAARIRSKLAGAGGTPALAGVGGPEALAVEQFGDGRTRRGGAAGADPTSAGGAAAVPLRATGRFGEILDGTTMILMEGSFVLLWAGLVMGAIWADHSWGRPWGWDPKEVFALNTFLIFAILIHVRFKVRDKGFWTAILAIIGAGVMLFNWIVINFVITGLHSYA